MPLFGRRLALCTRCLGLYPLLLALLALQAALPHSLFGTADWILVLCPTLARLLHWGAGFLDPQNREGSRGGTAGRLGAGALLGLGLSRGFWLYFNDPRSEHFWVQALLIVATALCFAFLRSLRPLEPI